MNYETLLTDLDRLRIEYTEEMCKYRRNLSGKGRGKAYEREDIIRISLLLRVIRDLENLIKK